MFFSELLELLASNGVAVGPKTTEPIIESPEDAVEEDTEEIIETVGDVDTE